VSGDSKAPRESAATALVAIAEANLEVFCGTDGKVYASRKGRNVANVVGESGGVVRDLLSGFYYELNGKVCGRVAAAEALDVMRARARVAVRKAVHVRTARVDGAVYVDLGWASSMENCYLCITPVGWRVEDAFIPEKFRRTELTGPIMALHPDNDLYEPGTVEIGSTDWLCRLRDLLNVKHEHWQIVVGWMVAVLLDGGPVPVLLLTGEQGTGKTSTARALVNLLDPSPAPVVSPPRDDHQWAIIAAARRVVCIDNLSTVPDWLSDALCRAVTGDGFLRRLLYSDDGIAMNEFRRAIILTSIDAGAIRGDLAERMLPVELDVIDPTARRSERELNDDLAAVMPYAFEEIVNLAWHCMGLEVDGVVAGDRPRMADFADILARIDHLTGWDSLEQYRRTVARSLADAISGDHLAEAVAALVATTGTWKGSAKELLDALGRWRPDDGRGWPKGPRGVVGALKRLAVPLRTQGIDVRTGRDHAGRWISLTAARFGAATRDAVTVVTVVPTCEVREKEEEKEHASRNNRHNSHDDANRHATDHDGSWPKSHPARCTDCGAEALIETDRTPCLVTRGCQGVHAQ
jgi:hypothetical protein